MRKAREHDIDVQMPSKLFDHTLHGSIIRTMIGACRTVPMPFKMIAYTLSLFNLSSSPVEIVHNPFKGISWWLPQTPYNKADVR